MAYLKLTWEDIFEARRLEVGLPAHDANRATRALVHLRYVLGEDVMALSELLLRFLTNCAPWTYRWVIWLSDCLTRLESVPGYAGVVKSLAHQGEFAAALSVIQVAERMQAAGLGIGFEIPVKVGGRDKYPDLQLYDQSAGITFYCEVSVSYGPERHVAASYVLDQVHSRCFLQRDGSLSYAGVMKLPSTEEETNELIELMQSEIASINAGASIRELTIPGVLTLILAPSKEADHVVTWAKARQLQLDSFGVDPGPIDHGARPGLKIMRKVEQLPDDLPNVLVIYAQDLFYAVRNPIDLVPVMTEYLSTYREVSILVLSGIATAFTDHPVITGSNYFFATSERDGQQQQNLVVQNASSYREMPDATLEKIRLAFSL